ncbi:OLC1v1014052C1 [Oldenlandia corymbosa var. corymbosa]|uniref:Phospholipid-transporting ATPase n=1 Tax=Oldenlandia corymbosa var. corymbosa TaxID=529605 RepID=A0AAV1E3D5_OLDCO|nr:OLC1v1014052C1 [Oldenlandia corymbosa var. corymbosa]
MSVGTRKKQHFSSVSNLSRQESLEHSLIGGTGFSRLVFCNEPESIEALPLSYRSNYVRTTKYTALSFLPKSLFEQFRRAANVFFLFSAILAFTPLSPTSPFASVVPFAFVVGISMVKELVEDLRRKKQDIEVNNRQVKVHQGNGRFDNVKWMDLRVGDVVQVEKDEFFPSDLVLLSSSYEDSICYVETTNLDGETNLKLKQALPATSQLHEDLAFKNFKALIRCEDPNANLYSFVGRLELEGQHYPLTLHQLLLRDSVLKNTDYIYGVIIFTGHDTKAAQNSIGSPSKRSKIDRQTDKLVYFLFVVLALMSFIGSLFFGIMTQQDLKDGRMSRWYLRPDETSIYYDPTRAPSAAVLQFFTAVVLYGYLIPISLYVSIEIVKVLQSSLINQDLHMYYEEGDKPARARTSYGRRVTEVERAVATAKRPPLVQDQSGKSVTGLSSKEKPSVKGFNFEDERIMHGNWIHEPHADVIQKFFRLLAICHTVIPDLDEETGIVSYEAESPDEAAFVVASRELGFEFCERSRTSISIYETDPLSGKKVKRVYDLLSTVDFSSSRKRMSMVVRDEEGNLFLLCKGADSVMFQRLATNGREFEEQTRAHINEYANAGLRTMVLAYRQLDEDEYHKFNVEYTDAKNSVSADQEKIVETIAEKIEKDLILLGAAAVEDKLQNGVPECIEKLTQAGIKIWVLTGDKMETAINIGFACSLLRQGMKQIIINSEASAFEDISKSEDGVNASEALKASILHQIEKGLHLLLSSGEKDETFSLIIDGKALSFALEHDMKDVFFELAISCATVICCRSTPKQKALVTRLVKGKTGRTTLAIGDGANDVGMLQEADIGVGISGYEGMQAVMSSDIAVGQFRFLERLLLVHGHWCYRRISSMICYYFYKNIAFGFTLFFYEAYASFSGQPSYNEWCLSLYNVFFTSLPAIALGVFDQDVSARLCLKFPMLYQQGIQNVLFSWFRIIGWALNAVLSSTCIFFVCILGLENQAFRKSGEVVGLEILGATMYTCVVWVVNCQMAFSVNYFTYIQHLFIWGGIASWYVFIMAFGALDPNISTTTFMVFIEACAPSPSFWLVLPIVLVVALLPYFTYTAVQMQFFPMYHQMIQLIYSQSSDFEYQTYVW